jgi:hypothetical protein
MLLREPGSDPRFESMKNQASKGSLARFLSAFGPALLEKYQPKGIVVFSAHWEEPGQVLGELFLIGCVTVMITHTKLHDN